MLGRTGTYELVSKIAGYDMLVGRHVTDKTNGGYRRLFDERQSAKHQFLSYDTTVYMCIHWFVGIRE